MNRYLYATLNNMTNVLPPYGRALDIRGWLASRVLKQCGVRLRISAGVNIYDPAQVCVGNHVYIGYGSYLGGGSISLDDEVVIGPYCCVVAGNHTMKDGSYRYGPYDYGSISIGKGTWLAAHVTVTNNVAIGRGCLIAAGAVVTKDVPDFSIVGGVPARLIKSMSMPPSQ